MFEIFEYDFMVRAGIAGVLIAAIAPVIGSFLIARRFSLMADTLAHISLVGIAAGVLLSLPPFLCALAVTITASILLERLRQEGKLSGDSLLSVFMTGSLALAVLFVSTSERASNLNLMSYLFGSITTITQSEVYMVAGLTVLVVLIFTVLGKQIFLTSFDQDFAQVAGIKITLVNMMFAIITAITVTLAIRVVGVLLIGALMILPILIIQQHVASFRSVVINASLLAMVSVIAGLFVSFYFDIPAGAAIVLLLVIQFVTARFVLRH